MQKKTFTEFIRYCFVGGLTTFINYAVYAVCLFFLDGRYLTANTIAWVFAVLFAFYSNKRFVFQAEGHSAQEALSFFSLRLVTLAVENALLYFFIHWLTLPVFVSKLAVSAVTVLSNYVLCKYKVFTDEKGGVVYEKN